MLTPRPKEPLIIGVVKALEHINPLLHDEILLFFGCELKHVHADRIIDITRVKIDDIIHALGWHHAHDFLDHVAVWVDKGKAASVHHILQGDVAHKNRLTHPRGTDDIHVPAPILFREPNFLLNPPKLIHPNQHAVRY